MSVAARVAWIQLLVMGGRAAGGGDPEVSYHVLGRHTSVARKQVTSSIARESMTRSVARDRGTISEAATRSTRSVGRKRETGSE